MPDIRDVDIDELLAEINARATADDQLALDEVRRHALKRYDDVQACPGSGKTTLVALKLLLLARRWADPTRGICVLSHTNVAKGEIINRLADDPYGRSLLGYPNFIGTIQDFVNTFFAIPYLRSNGWRARILEDDAYGLVAVKALRAKLGVRAQVLNGGPNHMLGYWFNQGSVKARDLIFEFKDGRLKPSLKIISDLAARVDLAGTGFNESFLSQAKRQICEWGYFTYVEMYAIARNAVARNSKLCDAVRARFPVVLCDEMQDTQDFQEEFLRQIFDANTVRMQCFGDPDQAIYDGGTEGGTGGYNRAPLTPITLSHRYTSTIATALTGLSYRRLNPLQTSRAPDQDDKLVTVIVYGEGQERQVLPRFAELVAELPTERRRVVKALGGVAVATGAALSLQRYHPSYSRVAASRIEASERLIDIVRYCAESSHEHGFQRYRTLNAGILTFLHACGRMHGDATGILRTITYETLKSDLVDRNKWTPYRHLLAYLVVRPTPNEVNWTTIMDALKVILALSVEERASEFLAYAPVQAAVPTENVVRPNRFVAENGVEIQIGTIHGAKGETHDATLVLETSFNGNFDVSTMLPYCLDHTKAVPVEDLNHPKAKASIHAGFMKKLYVAASRPRHLLCFALHSTRVSAELSAAFSDHRLRRVNV